MESEEGVPLQQRAAAAGIAACVSAVVVNPLDVVKTRLQAQGFRHAAATVDSAGAGFSGRTNVTGGTSSAPSLKNLAFATAGCPPTCPTNGNLKRLCAPECEVYTSSMDVLRKIVRQEGVKALFRGTSAALLVAVPTVGIYLPCYDLGNEYLRRVLQESNSDTLQKLTPITPIVAGGASRTLAVLCVAPLDLVRTRIQAERRVETKYSIGAGKWTASQPTVWSSLNHAARGCAVGCDDLHASSSRGSLNSVANNFSYRTSIRRLWTGTGPTLARDVPYSAAYWFTVEHLRSFVTGQVVDMKSRDARENDHLPTYKEKLLINFFSGVVAGGFVAGATTPLDVVKTRVQIRDVHVPIADFAGGLSHQSTVQGGVINSTIGPEPKKASGLVGELVLVAKQGGWRSLFAGWAPRAARAGPTCGIVLVAYEMAKTA